MTTEQTARPGEPSRVQIEALAGPVMLEFGTAWCGHCRAAQAHIAAALADHPNVRHIRITDGSGRPLGRSFRVKLWPTLIFLSDGNEIARVVHPREDTAIRHALAQVDEKRLTSGCGTIPSITKQAD
jgi:thioredoxin 1